MLFPHRERVKEFYRTHEVMDYDVGRSYDRGRVERGEKEFHSWDSG